MRPLKRPMFKYGGDVKRQGIMHGMNGLRDGGVATTMADATGYAGGGMTMPNMRGRVTGPGGYSGKKKKSFFKPTLGGVTGSVGLDAYLDPAPYMSLLQAIGAFKDGGSVGPGLVGDPRYPQQGGRAMHSEYLKNIYQAATPIVKNFFSPSKKLKQAKAVQKIAGKVPGMLQSAVQQAGPGIMSTRQAFMKNLKDFSFKKPKFLEGMGTKVADFYAKAPKKRIAGSAVAAPYVIEGAKKLPFEAIGDIITHPFKMYGKVFGIGKDKEPPPPPPPGEGGTGSNENAPYGIKEPRKPTQAEIDAETKALEDKKLKRIYSLLGVDRAQRGAASKALADMSRYIDEGGKDTISRKNIGSTLTKGILAFDKRLDKVDQLKEAAGLMMAKGEIEAMSNPLAKELQRTTIDVNRAKLDQAKDASTIKAKFQSTTGGGLTSPQAAKATAQYLYKNKYVGDIVDDDTFAELIKNNSKKGKSERETIVSVISGIAKDQAKPNGIYTAGDVIFEITDQAVSKIIVG